MKMRYFYTKVELFKLINTPKKYPTSHIFAALTQFINDNAEFIVDKYGRNGRLINIGDYYLFQPVELNFNNISIYERSVPIDYKHKVVNFKINTDAMNPVIDKHHISSEQTIANIEGQSVFNEMFKNYNTVYTVTEIGKKEDDWYKQCSMVIKKLMKEDDIIPAGSDEERLNLLDDLLVEHIVDMLIMNDKIHLLNYIYSIDNSDTFSLM